MKNGRKKYKTLRRTVQFSVILMLITPGLGFSFFQGSLIASSLFGIPLTDPLAFAEYLLASKSFYVTGIIGTLVIAVFYFIVRGRAFCAYVCPIHLISEAAGSLHKRFKITDRKMSLNAKYYFLGVTLFLSAVLSVPFFSSFSPIGGVSRALSGLVELNIPSDAFAELSAVSVGVDISVLLFFTIALFEIFFAENIWCRSLCPVGAVYSAFGKAALMKVKIDRDKCIECDECYADCMVGEVLDDPVYNGKNYVLDGNCSNCFNCIDSCPEDALSISFKFKRENKR